MRRELDKLREIFRRPRYVLLAVGVSVVAFAVYALLLNYRLILSTLLAGDVALLARLVPAFVLGYGQTVSTATLLLTAAVSAAIGVNIALIMFRLMEVAVFGREGASSLGGLVVAVVAPACPTCATAIFAVAGLTSVFALLPFNGAEFKVLALLMLIGSSVWLLSQIDQRVCEFC